MSSTYTDFRDTSNLAAGMRVDAYKNNRLHLRGVVETYAPDLGVLWIRELGIGSRKMLCLQDYQIKEETE